MIAVLPCTSNNGPVKQCRQEKLACWEEADSMVMLVEVACPCRKAGTVVAMPSPEMIKPCLPCLLGMRVKTLEPPSPYRMLVK